MWNQIITDQGLKNKIGEKIEEINGIIQNDTNIQADNSILDKFGGYSFYYNYYNLYRNENVYLDQNISFIEILVNRINSLGAVNYSRGISGPLFILDHLNKNDFIELDDHFFDLPSSLFDPMLGTDYIDFLHGNAGVAHYLVENNLNNQASLQLWCENLMALAEKEENLLRWKVQIGSEKNRMGYCLGLAHGVPAIMTILIKILKKYQLPIAEELLVKSSNYLVSCQNNPITEAYFPFSIVNNERLNVDRLSWCYGDLGCATSLYAAGEYLNNAHYRGLALEVLDFQSHRIEAALDKVADADFCHGTAGIAHMYARMYNYTGKELYRQTAEYCYQQTLDRAVFKDGLAGFKHSNGITFELENNYGLLEGISGIALCLISAISPVEPKWDASLLLS
jgi:lantibiotic modifying enzyme